MISCYVTINVIPIITFITKKISNLHFSVYELSGQFSHLEFISPLNVPATHRFG